MAYSDDQLLPLSGIQHFAYCPRQWGLIHIDQVWTDNHFTIEGQTIHRNVDDINQRRRQGEIITLRSHLLKSEELGLSGTADIIELHPTDEPSSYSHPLYPGYWKLVPLEYKRGKPKTDDCDALQLCAQAMCLEEMYGINIGSGVIFYHETRRREPISFTEQLRAEVRCSCEEMHRLYEKGTVPLAVKGNKCRGCSMYNLCLPKISSGKSVKNYNRIYLNEETA